MSTLVPESTRSRSCQVHVWRVRLPGPADRRTAFDRHLSAEEHARRQRFRFEIDGRRWAHARAALRVVLASYLGVVPSSILFDTGPWGKPMLRHAEPQLAFSMTHTAQIALIAITGGGTKVGIDAELIRSDVEWSDVSRRYFCPTEFEEIPAAPREQRLPAFFRCWTRKEALMKAVGAGLSIPLDTFRVSVLPGRPAEVLAVDSGPLARTRWQLIDLSDNAVCAALAVDVPTPVVRRFDFANLLAGRQADRRDQCQ